MINEQGAKLREVLFTHSGILLPLTYLQSEAKFTALSLERDELKNKIDEFEYLIKVKNEDIVRLKVLNWRLLAATHAS